MIHNLVEDIIQADAKHVAYRIAAASIIQDHGWHLTPDQALILLKLGDRHLAITDLMHFHIHIGQNVSYNVDRLTERGYLEKTPCLFDKRRVKVRLTDLGKKVSQTLLAQLTLQL